MPDLPEADAHWLAAALDAAHAAQGFLVAMEAMAEALAPDRLDALVADVREPHGERLRACRARYDAVGVPAALAPFAARLTDALDHVRRTDESLASLAATPAMARIPVLLAALHEVARAEETLYALRTVVPGLARHWQLDDTSVGEPAAPASGTGLLHVGRGSHHGGFTVYVPETYTPEQAWPLIVALHGGSGNGRDFVWTWLREAKSRGHVLVAPSSVASTWGHLEERGLLEILAWLDGRYRIDRSRVLLTGLSDGATFTLVYGLAHPDVFRALAPCCGVLHPANVAMGNLTRARGVPIYLVHGAQDFLFPVGLAHHTRDALTDAGAALVYRELPALSHTYPRSENVRILDWFAALPTDRVPTPES